MIKVKDIYSAIDTLAPFSTQESWDNSGLLAGDPDGEVTKVLTALDITIPVVEEAVRKGAELIISHHPVIFSPLKAVRTDTPVGMMLQNGISAICTHTPFDMAPIGMNKGLFDLLAAPLGLNDISESAPLEDCGEGRSIGRMYSLAAPLSPKECAERAKKALGCSFVRYTDGGKQISRIAISSGSGNSFARQAAAMGADALISGDFKHDVLIDDGINNPFTIIDCGHYHTERIFCGIMNGIVSKAFPEISVSSAESSADPAQYI